MSVLSIRELKQTATEFPAEFVIHAQLEAVNKKSTKGGSPFYEVVFADAEETLSLRVWENSPMFHECERFQQKGFFEITGQFQRNDQYKTIDAQSWALVPLSDEQADSVLAGSATLRAKQTEDYQFIESALAQVDDPRLKALGQNFLAQFGERFRRTGAARDYHHARRGGLVEHVAQMMRSAVQICEAYPTLNRDLLVIGVLFHDVGKLWENVYADRGFTMPYLEVGDLIGHIPMGMEIVNKLWRDLMDDDALAAEWCTLEPHSESVRLHLLHLIVAHHGEMAFGSPVVPKTPEAQALHYIDNLDAKMEMFDRGYQVARELGKNVYERVRPLPGRLIKPLDKFFVGEEMAQEEVVSVPEEIESVAPIAEVAVAAEALDAPEMMQEEEAPQVEEVVEPVQAEPEADSAPADRLPIPEPTEEELAKIDEEEEPF